MNAEIADASLEENRYENHNVKVASTAKQLTRTKLTHSGCEWKDLSMINLQTSCTHKKQGHPTGEISFRKNVLSDSALIKIALLGRNGSNVEFNMMYAIN